MAVRDFQKDIDSIGGIAAVPTILEVVCKATGMGFAAIARVTEDRWIACQVLDNIDFGLGPGGELRVETTICQEVKNSREPVVIDHVAEDTAYCGHPTPAMYGFQSYISMPIILPDGTFFGTLCAIDPRPARLKTPEVIGMFKLFAELIAFHLDARDRLKLSEENLLNERQAAELREQFIAVLGHDLRNPLAAIDSGARLLMRTPLNGTAIDVLRLMQNSVKRMSGIIDNVLDFARGRLGGGLPLQRQLKPLETTLMQVIEEARATWPERRIETLFNFAKPFDGDHGRLGQLLSNLLGNALTHGAETGPVRVQASHDEGGLELTVANSGEPIPPAALERLFQPFYRGEDPASLKGLGLGLFISSEIARAHGGRMDVASSPKETRFTLKIPAQQGG